VAQPASVLEAVAQPTLSPKAPVGQQRAGQLQPEPKALQDEVLLAFPPEQVERASRRQESAPQDEPGLQAPPALREPQVPALTAASQPEVASVLKRVVQPQALPQPDVPPALAERRPLLSAA
jgi:hypothetical protein